jgi:sugar fermentation stimulation protein A
MILFDEPVIEGRFLKRYKRFFIDALLPDDQQVVTHVPNTGSMLGLMAPNNRLLLTKSNDPKRKTLYTTQAIEVDGSMVGINTHLPNKLIKNSLDHPLLIDLKSYGRMQAEVPYGQGLHSRIDFYFESRSEALKVFFITQANPAHCARNCEDTYLYPMLRIPHFG